MNKLIKIFIVLLITMLTIIPNLPYKLPREIENSEYVKLTIYSETLTVVNGEDEIKKFANEMNYKKVNTREVWIKGNTPYKEITTFSQGYPKYRKFNIYGTFEKGLNQYNILTFNIKEWYPVDKYVCLKDTYTWKKHENIRKYIKILSFSILVILIGYLIESEYL